MRAVVASLALSLLACSSVEAVAPRRTLPAPAAQESGELPAWDPKKRTVAKVEVRGIEGTLGSYEVQNTMERLGQEFAACHEPRARRVPMLAGSLEFAIRVLHSGDVDQVRVRASSVGDRELERCFVDVIRAAHFPRPNGGDANIAYTMLLGPPGRAREPEVWTVGRVQHVVDQQSADVSQQCELPSGGAFTITAYVNARGRVIAAGVAAGESALPEHSDCIANALRRWSMPKPSKKRTAKVTFPLLTVDAS